MTPRRALAVLAFAASAACRSATPQGAAAPQVPSPSRAAPAAPAPFRAPEAIRWSRDSAEHRALFLQVYRAATAFVEREAASRATGTWAVILDADETVLDNSTYQLEQARAGKAFEAASWNAWCARREAVALPGAAAFLARVRGLGGKIAIVTNRTETECPDTEAVFEAQGLVYDVLLCKPDGGPSDKSPRFEAVARGTTPAGLPPLTVIAFLGDNIYDFPGQSQAIRTKGDDAFDPFGARFFVLPNPMYGSWERN
ncbi:MAG TPA: HAD family acid phosphatase [Vicinamibacteria bacterium]|nr:HAD family acid phosphatase [Vicinamibacteria bacterium]